MRLVRKLFEYVHSLSERNWTYVWWKHIISKKKHINGFLYFCESFLLCIAARLRQLKVFCAIKKYRSSIERKGII